LLLLEALVASVDREKFTGELMYIWELLILEIIVEANSKKETLKMQLHFAKVQEQINFTFNQVNTIYFTP
jgi:hypothetical protein